MGRNGRCFSEVAWKSKCDPKYGPFESKFRPQILKICSLLKAGDDALRVWADSDHVKPWPEYEGGLIGLAGICLISSIIGLIW